MTGSSARSTMSIARKPRNQLHFWCGALCGAPTVRGSSWNSSSMVDAARIDRLRLQRLQHQQRHDHGARPVRDLVDVERKPLRQQHDLHRHHRHAVPADHAVEREQRAGEHVRFHGAAARQDRLARAPHVIGIDVVADHLQREVGLHARAHVEFAVMEQRPAAMRALDAAQIDADLALQLEVRRLARSNAPSARIRPGWWRRPRARRPSARPAAGRRGSRRSRRRCGAPARDRADPPRSPACRACRSSSISFRHPEVGAKRASKDDRPQFGRRPSRPALRAGASG